MTQQQYTPVSWQDETTSQQGTLINAERLNQMQTAHHYADGLEEVDTVPTADPGVDYHKVVYCTADNTLYRWDGTQWTADIDDPTRELLEEHLADHDNPHQVTKAQVGLGNCDNTSDLDKPISTATQTALNAKADKSDTYTKAQVDTALATKADKTTTYTKTETDTLLGAKADKTTTLAGYGIADAYTKSEADTLLGAKADQATTYTKTEVNTALALKADKSDTYTKAETDTLLSAKANDNAVVHLAGAETIPGAKTFTALTKMFAINYERTGGYLEQCKVPTEERGTVPASQVQIQPLTINDKDDQQLYFEQYIAGTDGARRFRKNIYTTQGTRVQIEDLWAKPDGTGWRGSPTLPDDAPTNALTTINWVSQTGDNAPNNLIHKSGNESKDGNLTLLKPLFISRTDNGACYIQIKDMGFDCATIPSSTITRQIYEAYDKDNHRMLTFYMGRRANGSNLLNMTIRNFDANGDQIGQGALILNSYSDGTVDLRLQDGLGHDIQVGHT